MKIGRNYFALIAEGHTPAVSAGMLDLTPSFLVGTNELAGGGAIFIAPAVGTAGFLTITLTAPFVVGETIRITITSNLVSRQLYRKSFVQEVLAGDTVTTIAARFAAAMAQEAGSLNSPFASATSALGVITVTQQDDDKRGLIGYTYTDSVAGTVVNVPTATVISEGQPSDLEDRGIDAGDINLASYDTVRIDLAADAAIPFIDSEGSTAKEIYWFGSPGDGALLAALINAL